MKSKEIINQIKTNRIQSHICAHHISVDEIARCWENVRAWYWCEQGMKVSFSKIQEDLDVPARVAIRHNQLHVDYNIALKDGDSSDQEAIKELLQESNDYFLGWIPVAGLFGKFHDP